MSTLRIPGAHKELHGGKTPKAATRRGLLRSGAALGSIAVLAACAPLGGGAQTGQASREPVTLLWSPYSDQPTLDTVKKTLPAFTAKYPYITVTLAPMSEGNGAGQIKAYGAQLAGGSAPDVIGHCCFTGPVLGQQGTLVSLDPLLKRDNREVPLADFIPALMAYWSTPKGGHHALPQSAFTMGLYDNRTVFRRKGIPFPDDTWDWNKLRDVMVQLNAPDQTQWGYYHNPEFGRMGLFVRQNGGHEVDPKDNTKAAFDSSQALGALQWLYDRMWKDGAMAKAADISALGVPAPNNALAQGNLAMLMEGSWQVSAIMTSAPHLADQWDVTVLPKGPVQRDTHASTDGWSIPTISKLQEPAWLLLKFLQTETWLAPAIAGAGYQPARKSQPDGFPAAMTRAYPGPADKNIASLTDGQKKDYSHPNELWKRHPDSAQVFADTMAAVFTRNEKPVADAFRAAAQQINAINAAS
jgi:multiple sugar transport system substrate-binding protein